MIPLYWYGYIFFVKNNNVYTNRTTTISENSTIPPIKESSTDNKDSSYFSLSYKQVMLLPAFSPTLANYIKIIIII